MHRQTTLRPSQGGKFHKPVGPSKEVLEQCNRQCLQMEAVVKQTSRLYGPGVSVKPNGYPKDTLLNVQEAKHLLLPQQKRMLEDFEQQQFIQDRWIGRDMHLSDAARGPKCEIVERNGKKFKVYSA